jgi:hypothetical protein
VQAALGTQHAHQGTLAACRFPVVPWQQGLAYVRLRYSSIGEMLVRHHDLREQLQTFVLEYPDMATAGKALHDLIERVWRSEKMGSDPDWYYQHTHAEHVSLTHIHFKVVDNLPMYHRELLALYTYLMRCWKSAGAPLQWGLGTDFLGLAPCFLPYQLHMLEVGLTPRPGETEVLPGSTQV